MVWLATDEDPRGGHQLAPQEALKLPDDKGETDRLPRDHRAGHQTRPGEPRGIDVHLVDAQQTRRVLDRLVGYERQPDARRR